MVHGNVVVKSVVEVCAVPTAVLSMFTIFFVSERAEVRLTRVEELRLLFILVLRDFFSKSFGHVVFSETRDGSGGNTRLNFRIAPHFYF